jgi:hypothetical protein
VQKTTETTALLPIYYAKTPDFLDELDRFLLDELLFFFFSDELRNLRCIMARLFLRFVNKIPKNIITDPMSMAVPNPYFNLFVKDRLALEVSFEVVR